MDGDRSARLYGNGMHDVKWATSPMTPLPPTISN